MLQESLSLSEPEEIVRYLIDKGLVGDAEKITVEELSGGVSGNVWKIVSGTNRWVLKQALARLKVKEIWSSDTGRAMHEASVMKELAAVLPQGAVPGVLFTDPQACAYLMTCADEGAIPWKSRLMAGDFNRETAFRAGNLLSRLHSGNLGLDAETRRRLDGSAYFEELRIQPFHRHLAGKYPALRDEIGRLIDEVTAFKVCLVHGDFSPKNLLVNEDGSLVLLDYEAAHWGNPVFDLAFCIAHLMLKGWALRREEESLHLIVEFLRGYGSRMEAGRLIPHLGLMLLARMDGKSPVDYVTDAEMRDTIRNMAMRWIGLEREAAEPIVAIASELRRPRDESHS